MMLYVKIRGFSPTAADRDLQALSCRQSCGSYIFVHGAREEGEVQQEGEKDRQSSEGVPSEAVHHPVVRRQALLLP